MQVLQGPTVLDADGSAPMIDISENSGWIYTLWGRGTWTGAILQVEMALDEDALVWANLYNPNNTLVRLTYNSFMSFDCVGRWIRVTKSNHASGYTTHCIYGFGKPIVPRSKDML